MSLFIYLSVYLSRIIANTTVIQESLIDLLGNNNKKSKESFICMCEFDHTSQMCHVFELTIMICSRHFKDVD